MEINKEKAQLSKEQIEQCIYVLETLNGDTLTIPLGAMAPGFVAPKFDVPINGLT